ncbi:ATP-binding protein [Halogeometricum borinquense]|uniref:ATP-binding protein n=1 Tax=Halogeometricum borinquense TaxID=60847 RepID=A0A6C0UNB6_9EURY|nr:ATP-binding protein [Halogeometricum borinquense]QIB75389.1 ATP-binding protein [Halogeometricum borinquense]
MDRDQLVDVEALLRMADDAGVPADHRLREFIRAAGAVQSRSVARITEQAITSRIAQFRGNPFDDSGPETAAASTEQPWMHEVELGVVPTGGRFTLPVDELTKHAKLLGQSGMGKTTAIYQLALELDRLDIPWWAFDLKRDYRHLADRMDVLVLPWDQLKINPLEPPTGTDPRQWAQLFADVFGFSAGLLSASKNYTMTRLLELYEDRGVLDDPGPDAEYPSFHEFRDFVAGHDASGQKQHQYRGTVLNRLDAWCSITDGVFDCRRGHDLGELLQRNVVFELENRSRDLQDFMMELLFFKVFQYRMSQNQRDNSLRHVFLLDEGKRVFSVYKERQDAAGLPMVDIIAGQMRQFGEGLIVADQEPAKLTDSIRTNTATTMLLPLREAEQFQAVAADMSLSKPQKAWARTLNVGQGIVQRPNGTTHVVNFHDPEVVQSVDDGRLAELMQTHWNRLTHSTATSLEQRESREAPDADTGDGPESPEPKSNERTIDQDILTLLKDVAKRPFVSLSERYSRFSSDGKGYKVKTSAVDDGYVTEHVVKDRGQKKLLELTEQGRTVLRKRGESIDRDGRGGIVHQYWQHRLRSIFEAEGLKAELESDDADIAVESAEERFAVEVSMQGAEREVEHVADRLDAGFDRVVFACPLGEVMETLIERLTGADINPDAVRVHAFHEFYDVDSVLAG